MATFIKSIHDGQPNYLALSTEISGSKISDVGIIGAIVYMTDTKKNYIVLNDLTLVQYNVTTGS